MLRPKPRQRERVRKAVHGEDFVGVVVSPPVPVAGVVFSIAEPVVGERRVAGAAGACR